LIDVAAGARKRIVVDSNRNHVRLFRSSTSKLVL
jgi:hypothetical protein